MTMNETWKRHELWKDETDLKKCVKRFFEILDTKETSDNDKEFHPVEISSVRVFLTHELNHLLPTMKRLAND
jgi:hypothetical protein